MTSAGNHTKKAFRILGTPTRNGNGVSATPATLALLMVAAGSLLALSIVVTIEMSPITQLPQIDRGHPCTQC